MADEYISRKAAIDAIKAMERHDFEEYQITDAEYAYNDGLIDAMNAVAAVPAADVAEERHGRWTHERLASTTGGTYPAIRCSVCETAVPIFDAFPYCPNCGAKMDEREERHGDICDKCVHGEYCAMAAFGGHNPKITACYKYAERQKMDEEVKE